MVVFDSNCIEELVMPFFLLIYILGA